MSDYERRPQQQRAAFLSRALSAYTVKSLTGISDEDAGKSITDAFQDRGIDAIFYDTATARLLLVQAKWSDGITWKDMGEFTDGVRRLIGPDFESFAKNDRIYSRRTEIQSALLASSRILLVTVHHGPKPADASALNRVDELVAEIDGGSDLAGAVHWHQRHLLEAMQSESAPPSISAEMYLSNWGEIKEPYHAVFGRVQGAAIAELGRNHPHLAHMNLRERLQRSDVNAAIAETAAHEPQHFWYFNNGLTIICDSIRPAVLGRLNPEVALFKLDGISLVNGAQTTGMVCEHFDRIPEDQQDKLWLQVRIIAVKNCPDGFAKRVTRYTNLQNAVTLQDFVSMDPVQSRLATDFAIQKRRYAFRSGGDPGPSGDHGCTLREATIALACAEPDLRVAVQGKREISLLWVTDNRDFYQRMFHDQLTATRLWNAVVILRQVQSVIETKGGTELPRADAVANHMQWVITHLVFRSPLLRTWDTSSDVKDLLPAVRDIAGEIFDRMRLRVSVHHANEYLAALSKSFEKCEALVRALECESEPPNLLTGFY